MMKPYFRFRNCRWSNDGSDSRTFDICVRKDTITRISNYKGRATLLLSQSLNGHSLRTMCDYDQFCDMMGIEDTQQLEVAEETNEGRI